MTHIIYTREFITRIGNNRYDLSKNEIIELTKLHSIFPKRDITANTWRAPVEVIQQKEPTTDLMRLMNSYLNKLSHKNYNKILESILECLDKSPILIDALLNNIFEKAILQTGYCGIYAQLCTHINDKYPLKELLLNKCMSLYDCAKTTVVPNPEVNYDAFCNYMSEKTKYVGNFQLIGELYKYDLIGVDILQTYIKLLMEDMNITSTNPEVIAVIEKYCESFCKLIKTVGKKLSADKTVDINELYLTNLKKMAKNKTFCNRIRFMFQDILDL